MIPEWAKDLGEQEGDAETDCGYDKSRWAATLTENQLREQEESARALAALQEAGEEIPEPEPADPSAPTIISMPDVVVLEQDEAELAALAAQLVKDIMG